jgi:hypothetical protein
MFQVYKYQKTYESTEMFRLFSFFSKIVNECDDVEHADSLICCRTKKGELYAQGEDLIPADEEANVGCVDILTITSFFISSTIGLT